MICRTELCYECFDGECTQTCEKWFPVQQANGAVIFYYSLDVCIQGDCIPCGTRTYTYSAAQHDWIANAYTGPGACECDTAGDDPGFDGQTVVRPCYISKN